MQKLTTLACWVAVLALASCSSGHTDEDRTEDSVATPGQQSEPLRGGTVWQAGELGKVGVVDFFLDGSATNDDPTNECTGSMIAPNVVLAAAHCFDDYGARTASSGTNGFTIRYFDPKVGRRIVFQGDAAWFVAPTYNGNEGDNGAGDANDDMGIIVIPGEFALTDYRDYLRIYADVDGPLRYANCSFGFCDDALLTLFGAGRFTYSAMTDANLRSGSFPVEDVDANHIVIDSLDDLNPCAGDSGGPLIHYTTLVGNQLPTIAGVMSNGDIDPETEGTWCTNNDPPHDNAHACRISANRVSWLEGVAGISCQPMTGAVVYKRCFAIPFIEEVAGEGLDQAQATAQLMAFL
jgi:hypothetical protein